MRTLKSLSMIVLVWGNLSFAQNESNIVIKRIYCENLNTHFYDVQVSVKDKKISKLDFNEICKQIEISEQKDKE